MNDDTTFEDLIESYLELFRNGTAPEIDDFTHLHPEYADRLAELLPLMVKMEGCAADARRIRAASGGEFPDLSGSDYRLVRKIGAGGMGEVFEATQISLDRKVAVKVLSPSLTSDPAQREQFENEARVIAMLHHPNIVKIYNAGVSADRCYYAMELIDGTGLNRCETTAPREIARLGLQAARALAYAHRCGVLHCDVKPANLLLDKQGEIHIGDFGLAFVQKDADGNQGKSGMRSGTLRYMAPERLKHGVKSFAGDQYSFGVTLYELIAHAPVLPEQNPQKLADRIRSGPLPPLHCAEPDLAAIVNRCVSYDPAARYPGMADVASDLEHFLRHEPVSAADTSAFRRFRLWAKRKPAVAALSLLALTAIAAFAAAVTVGYVRTNSALRLAEKNAAAANAALSDIFAHIEHRTPTSSGSELLSRLMPYYQDIAEQRNLPQSEIADMNLLIGTAAMRSGNYPLAENAFRRAADLRADAATLNLLAVVLRQQGKTVQAGELSRRVIEDYPRSCEAVRAYQSLGEYDAASELLRSLLLAEPENPDYLYQYVLLLETQPGLAASDPISGIAPDPPEILGKLVKQYPDRMEFSLALVDLMSRRLNMQTRFSTQERQSLEQALALADHLLAWYPNTPEVASAAVELYTAYIARLRRSGDQTAVRSETARLQGMLEILYRGPDAPDEVKETLLEMQLEQLGQMNTPARPQAGAVQELAAKIRDELNDYQGDRLAEFRTELAGLEARLPTAARPGAGPGRQPVQPGRQPAQPGRQAGAAAWPGTTTPGRQNPVAQQRSRTRTPAAPQNGRGGRDGTLFMPPAGGVMRPFAPNNRTTMFNREWAQGGVGRNGRNESASGRNLGAENGRNESAAGRNPGVETGRNESAAGRDTGVETGRDESAAGQN